MVKGAHRSRRKQKNTHYGLVDDGDIAIIAPRLGDPNQQVTGNIRDGGVGQRFYNRWKKSKNLLSHCFFDLKGLPGSLDQTDYHDTSYLLEEKKKNSTAHLQSLRPLVTVNTAAGTFQASCLSIVIVILSLDVLERFRHKNRKSKEVTAHPMTPKVVLIADDSLHTSLTTDYESTLRVIGHNFGFVVLGTSKYFRSQPYLQYVGVHGHAGGRTFLDSWYSIFGGELRLQYNTPSYPPASLLMALNDKLVQNRYLSELKLPYSVASVPLITRTGAVDDDPAFGSSNT